jgi:D-2-hydroxyacid dehydrogenase (NADP+)
MIVIINRFVKEHVRRISQQQVEQLRLELQEQVVLLDRISEADEQMMEAEIIVGFNPDIDAETMRRFSKLKWVHTLTSGADRMCLEYFAEKGIIVTNSRGIHNKQISEQIMGMMICFSRRLHLNIRNQLHRKWDTDYMPEQLSGKTIVIIGAGSIGGEVARKCKAFDMKVVGVRRSELPQEHYDTMASILVLPELLQESDFVVVLLPLTPHTRRMFGHKEFALMKKTGIFLNFSRGGVVDEQALIHALQNGEIGGAGLDVFSEEPLPPDNSLWGMEHVIMSPHSSGSTAHLEIRELELFQQLYVLYRNSGDMFNKVSLEQSD